ncbi:MAG: hypothetical protein IKO57_03325 [Treponema sp.]|nr:hypothetical protein [Treponema sp.]
MSLYSRSRNALTTTSTEPQLWKSAPQTAFKTPEQVAEYFMILTDEVL